MCTLRYLFVIPFNMVKPSDFFLYSGKISSLSNMTTLILNSHETHNKDYFEKQHTVSNLASISNIERTIPNSSSSGIMIHVSIHWTYSLVPKYLLSTSKQIISIWTCANCTNFYFIHSPIFHVIVTLNVLSCYTRHQ